MVAVLVVGVPCLNDACAVLEDGAELVPCHAERLVFVSLPHVWSVTDVIPGIGIVIVRVVLPLVAAHHAHEGPRAFRVLWIVVAHHAEHLKSIFGLHFLQIGWVCIQENLVLSALPEMQQ